MRRFSFALRVAVIALIAALTTSLAPAVANAHGDGRHRDDRDHHGVVTPADPVATISLPNGFQPEGIAIRGKTAYFGSLATGDIYAASLRTGTGKVISQGPGTPSAGLAVDGRGRLFVSGGSAGNARVVDTRTGKVLATYPLASGTSFINDVALTSKMAWFTDSSNPVLYGVLLVRSGHRGWHKGLPTASAVVSVPLTGDYVHGSGFNLNGIVAFGNKQVLAVQSNTGKLLRIDTRTGVATAVDLGGVSLTNGDGLLLKGRTLYVVQNQQNQVAVIKLNRWANTGTLTRTITDPGFDVPTTVASFGKWLYLPNARFTTTPTADTTYSAVRVTR